MSTRLDWGHILLEVLYGVLCMGCAGAFVAAFIAWFV